MSLPKVARTPSVDCPSGYWGAQFRSAARSGAGAQVLGRKAREPAKRRHVLVSLGLASGPQIR